MKRRILLVDDELRILLTLKAVLEMNGFDVDTASSAREGIEKLAADGPYHMVITDMKMETSRAGYDVIRAATRQPYNPAIAILTAYAELGADWRSEGADSLLVKPIGTDDLLRQVEAMLISHEDEKANGKAKTAPRRSEAQASAAEVPKAS